MATFTTIKIARKALGQWRDLPEDERVRLQGEADAVRRLATELAGPAAEKLLGSDAGSFGGTRESRDRKLVLGELSSAVAALSGAIGTAVGQAAHDSSRTVRIGSKLVKRLGR